MKEEKRKKREKFRRLFAEELRKIRIQKGITQNQMAKRLGVKVQEWQSYEYGVRNFTLEVIFPIAKALDVPPALLFSVARKVYEEVEKM